MEITRDVEQRGGRVSGSSRIEDDLHLDRVVASQPEIGPTPPDGGYGWLIVVSAVMYHITVPGLLTMYGFTILKCIKEEEQEDGDVWRVWDVHIALVPVVMVVMRLLLEGWSRAVVKLFNMPRFMALAGLCLTVAGVLLSSYTADYDSNIAIVNIFAGLFAGAGCALTGQQTEVIVTHYFRDKLTIAQRIIRVAPSIGNCVIPIILGFLNSRHTADVVVMIYAAILMQNCLFLAAYTRPIYIERVLRNTYKMIIDAVEDEDEVIFSNQNNAGVSNHAGDNPTAVNSTQSNQHNAQLDDGDDHIVVFNSKVNAKEIFDPSVQLREKGLNRESRFSSDFSTMYNDGAVNENRFSSDFSNIAYQNVNGYQELENIDSAAHNPQPLYRETTVNSPAGNYVVDPNMTDGTARRTATIKKNIFVVVNMLKDINFYLYTLFQLSSTFSVLMFAVLLPSIIWTRNPSLNIWRVSITVTIMHVGACCLVMLCSALPKFAYEKNRLCIIACTIGALGFYGVTLSSSPTLLIIWGLFCSFSTSMAALLQQPLYNNMLNEFDTTATITTANTVVAVFIMIWCVSFNYEYSTCLFTASILQSLTALVFLASLIKRR